MGIKNYQTWPILLLGLSISVLSACTQSSPTSTQQIPSSDRTNPATKVVATNSVLCNMTRQIADTTVDLTCLIKPGVDPHLYQATPEDRKAIE